MDAGRRPAATPIAPRGPAPAAARPAADRARLAGPHRASRSLSRPHRHTPRNDGRRLAAARGHVHRAAEADDPARAVHRRLGRPPELWVVACDYATGRRVPFGRSRLAARRPRPTPWRPRARSRASTSRSRSAGRRYVDGGVCSVSNLDLLAGRGLDLVICLNPSSRAPTRAGRVEPGRARRGRRLHRLAHPAASRARLEREERKVRRFGTQVVLIEPTAEDHAAMGPKLDEHGAPPGRDRHGRARPCGAAARARGALRCSRPAEGRAAQRSSRPRARRRRGPSCSHRPHAGRREAARESATARGIHETARARKRRGAGSRLARADGRPLIGAIAQEAQRRIPSADLDERDPDYIRETLPGCGCWRRSTSARRCGAREHPGGGPGAAGGQPLGRERHARHAPSSRWRSTPTSEWSGASTSSPTTSCCRCRASACCASTAPSPPSPENAAARARLGRRAARLPGRRLRDAPAELGVRTRWTSAAARASSGSLKEDVPLVPVVAIGGQETALFLSRGERLAQAVRARPDVPAEGAADLARAAVGAQRRRHAAATSRSRRRSRSRCCRRSTSARVREDPDRQGLRAGDGRCRRRSPGSPRSGTLPVIG